MTAAERVDRRCTSSLRDDFTRALRLENNWRLGRYQARTPGLPRQPPCLECGGCLPHPKSATAQSIRKHLWLHVLVIHDCRVAIA